MTVTQNLAIHNRYYRVHKLSTPKQVLRSAKRIIRRSRRLPSWAFVAAGLFLLLFWNWQLVGATIAGGSVMTMVYVAQSWNWQTLPIRVQKFLNSPNRSLIVAVTSGVSTVLLTYVIFGVWTSVENHWLASVEISQFLVILVVLLILTARLITQSLRSSQQHIDRLITQLTADDELERLIAVRQIAQSIQEQRLPFNQEKAIAEYCQILLSRETVPMVREATLDVLAELKYLPQIKDSL